MNFPNIFFMMPPKTGTTSLFYTLSRHPDFQAAKKKETNFFTEWMFKGNFYKHFIMQNKSMDEFREYYSSQWETDDNRIKFEISPQYCTINLCDEGLLASIRSLVFTHPSPEDIKIIFVSRNPIDRFLSQYIHYRSRYNIASNKETNDKFVKTIDWANEWNLDAQRIVGQRTDCITFDKKYLVKDYNQFFQCYHFYPSDNERILKEILTFIKEDNVLILKYEDFKSDYKEFILKICKFTNASEVIDWNVMPNIQTNTGSLWSKWFDIKKEIKDEDMGLLTEYFSEYNERYKNLTGIDYNE